MTDFIFWIWGRLISNSFSPALMYKNLNGYLCQKNHPVLFWRSLLTEQFVNTQVPHQDKPIYTKLTFPFCLSFFFFSLYFFNLYPSSGRITTSHCSWRLRHTRGSRRRSRREWWTTWEPGSTGSTCIMLQSYWLRYWHTPNCCCCRFTRSRWGMCGRN